MYVITLSGESYYIIRQKVLHYQAKIITLSGEGYYIIRQKLLHYEAASVLHFRVMLLHYQAVITLAGGFNTLSDSYYINRRLLHYRL